MVEREQELWYLHPPGVDRWIGGLENRPCLYQRWNPCLDWQREEEGQSVRKEDATIRERLSQAAAPPKRPTVPETGCHRQVKSEEMPRRKAN